MAERQETELGDPVVISPSAPERFRPSSRAWVVGLTQPNRGLLTIEFEDGTSVEIPPDLVQRSEHA